MNINMAMNNIMELLSQYKETIWLIVTWASWSLAHMFNKSLKWETMSFREHMAHLFISWFVWYMVYLLLEYANIDWDIRWFIIWMCSYSSIQIIWAIDMFKAKAIYNLIIDFIKFKIWK